MNQRTICKSQNYLQSKELFADQRFNLFRAEICHKHDIRIRKHNSSSDYPNVTLRHLNSVKICVHEPCVRTFKSLVDLIKNSEENFLDTKSTKV